MDENGDSQETEVERAREEVIEAMATTAEMYGTKRSLGRLYGILYFADGPLSLDALAERSDYAKSTVSSAMSTLERYHLVKRRSLSGEGKRAFFEAERDWWDVMRRWLETQGRREVMTMNRALDTAKQRLEASDSPDAEHDLARVSQLQEYYGQIEQFVNLLSELSPEEMMAFAEAMESPDSDR